jgi:nicotinate-nucleotide adenylyltransferase
MVRHRLRQPFPGCPIPRHHRNQDTGAQSRRQNRSNAKRRPSDKLHAPLGRPKIDHLTMTVAGYTAIYGGSFDPPHMGHQMACLYLLQALEMEAVWLVPTAQHAFGKSLIPYAHRRAMCELMAQPFGQQVQISDVERDAGGTSYSLDTLSRLKEQHPERRFAVVIGADVVADLPRWHRACELVQLAPLVVLGRAGVVPPRMVTVGTTVVFMEPPQVNLPDISSRGLRAALGHSDYPSKVDQQMPKSVAHYIMAHGLYHAH